MGAYKDGTRVDIPAANPIKCSVFQVQTDNNYNSYRVQKIAATGSWRFPFCIPSDFVSAVSLSLIMAASGGAVGASKDIDLYSDYGNLGESVNQHSQSDTTSLYTLSGPDTWEAFDILPLFSSIVAGDQCGIFVDCKGIGGAIYIKTVDLVYSTQ